VIKSSLKYENYGLSKDDKFSFSLSQPHRVSSGSMDVQVAGLASRSGSIPYELDMSIGYDRDFSKLATGSVKINLTRDSGHTGSTSSWDDRSLYLGLMKNETFGLDQVNIGTVFSNTNNRPSFNLQYKINF